MAKENKSTATVRKEGAKHGTITQKMMSFRCDNDLQLWLESQQNKGRYINNLIREDMKKHAALQEKQGSE